METTRFLAVAAVALGAYLIGGIPFGLLVGKAAKGIDVREHGSKNIGATNVGRVIGWRWGALVLALDGLKGFAPVCGVAETLGPGPDARTVILAVGLAVIVGHLAPIYLGFKGGKGVATSAGVFLALTPSAAGIALAVFLVTVAAFRMVSLGSVLASVALPIAYGWYGPPETGLPDGTLLLCLAAAALVIVRHRANLQRIAAGTEPRIGRSKE